MRPRKRSPQVDALLDEVARLKFETPTYHELEIETGIGATYLRAIVSKKVRALIELSNQCMNSDGA